MFEGHQRRTRIEAEVIAKDRSDATDRGEGVGLSASSVQRQTQLAPQALTVRLGGHEGLELGDQLDVPAGGEIGLDPSLHGKEAELRDG